MEAKRLVQESRCLPFGSDRAALAFAIERARCVFFSEQCCADSEDTLVVVLPAVYATLCRQKASAATDRARTRRVQPAKHGGRKAEALGCRLELYL
eukprot:1381197-Pleurochrysis_carterae.AAC.2